MISSISDKKSWQNLPCYALYTNQFPNMNFWNVPLTFICFSQQSCNKRYSYPILNVSSHHSTSYSLGNATCIWWSKQRCRYVWENDIYIFYILRTIFGEQNYDEVEKVFVRRVSFIRTSSNKSLLGCHYTSVRKKRLLWEF